MSDPASDGLPTRARKDVEKYLLPEERAVVATRRHWAVLIEPTFKFLPVFAIGGWLLLFDPANRVTWTHPAGFSGPGFLVGELFVWGFTAYLLDGLFDLAGWTVPWDGNRVADIPERFMRGRRR